MLSSGSPVAGGWEGYPGQWLLSPWFPAGLGTCLVLGYLWRRMRRKTGRPGAVAMGPGDAAGELSGRQLAVMLVSLACLPGLLLLVSAGVASCVGIWLPGVAPWCAVLLSALAFCFWCGFIRRGAGCLVNLMAIGGAVLLGEWTWWWLAAAIREAGGG